MGCGFRALDEGELHMIGGCRGVRLAMASRSSFTAISLVTLLAFSSVLCAQGSKPPTLGEILDRLQANLDYYDTRLPSLFCDEHVVSSQVEPGMRDLNTTTDSVFRLKRTPK